MKDIVLTSFGVMWIVGIVYMFIMLCFGVNIVWLVITILAVPVVFFYTNFIYLV